MTVTLINNTSRMLTFILPHAVYCKSLGECICRVIQRKTKRVLCESLTIPAGGKVENLPDAIVRVEKIKEAIQRGDLNVVHEKVPVKEPTTNKTKPVTPMTKPGRKKKK